MGVAFVCLQLLRVLASGQEPSTTTEQPTIWEPYKEAWDTTKGQINLEAMESWLADLESQDQGLRTGALKHFQEETRITDYVTEPPKEAREEQKQLVVWGKYVKAVKLVVEKWMPLVLQTPTHDLQTETWREGTVRHIGEEAPHPAFVPLLREIALNQEENEEVRRCAIIPLSAIPHEGMVEFLIDCLDLEPFAVRAQARDQLIKLTMMTKGTPQRYRTEPKDVKGAWQRWWSENKDKFKYERWLAFFNF